MMTSITTSSTSSSQQPSTLSISSGKKTITIHHHNRRPRPRHRNRRNRRLCFCHCYYLTTLQTIFFFVILLFVVGSLLISSSILHIIHNNDNNDNNAVAIITIINDNEPTTTTTTTASTTTTTTTNIPIRTTKNTNTTTTATTTTVDVYKRFDEMGPKEIFGVTLEWKSLPDIMKYPAAIISKDEFTKQKLWLQRQRQQHYYYSEINPSILKINDPNILPLKFQQKLRPNNDGPTTTPRRRKIEYVVSSRITNINNCHKRVFKKQYNNERKQHHQNLLGLAFLDIDLQIIADVVIDLQFYFPLFKFEDYRLFYIQEQLYVSSFQWAYPIWFNIPSLSSSSSTEGSFDPTSIIHLTSINSNNSSTTSPPREDFSFDVYTIQNHHVCLGYDIMKNLNPFEINSINSSSSTTNTTTTTTTKTLLELYPMGTIVDITKRFNIIKKKHTNTTNNNSNGGIMNDMTTATTTTINKANCRGGRGGGGSSSIKQQQQQRQVKPSFKTVEELYFQRHKLKSTKVLSGPRGGSCCVGPIQMPFSTTTTTNNNNNNVSSIGGSSSSKSNNFLLGILHYQLYWKSTNYPGNVGSKQYYSAFYALDPRDGTTIALSGKFCLPGHHTTTSGTSTNSNNTNLLLLSTWNNQTLHLDMNQVFNCPKIHFVSGMALTTTTTSTTDDDDHNDDDDNHNNQQRQQQLILGYGVNDCTSRLIKVNLQDVINLLWPTSSSSSSFG